MTWEDVIKSKRRKIIVPKKYGNKQKIKSIKEENKKLEKILARLESELKRFQGYIGEKASKDFPEIKAHFAKVIKEITEQISKTKNQIDDNKTEMLQLDIGLKK